jgi:hypothetical protein
MDTRLKISVHSPRKENLTGRQQRFLEAIIDQIERSSFYVLPESPSTAGIKERHRKMAQCHGAVVLAFSQWECRRLSRDERKTLTFPTEFVHIGTALAIATSRPLLLLREKSVSERGCCGLATLG